jgi:hypothetical protein
LSLIVFSIVNWWLYLNKYISILGVWQQQSSWRIRSKSRTWEDFSCYWHYGWTVVSNEMVRLLNSFHWKLYFIIQPFLYTLGKPRKNQN